MVESGGGLQGGGGGPGHEGWFSGEFWSLIRYGLYLSRWWVKRPNCDWSQRSHRRGPRNQSCVPFSSWFTAGTCGYRFPDP